MECFYINLEAEEKRRRLLQGNFDQYKDRGWFLTRVAAVDGRRLAARPVQGRIGDAEKGRFLSHRRAIEASLEAPGHALIVEDDVMFGPSSCVRIDGAIGQRPDSDWDLLFTDVVIPHPPLMAALLHMRRQLGDKGGQMLLNVNDLNYCGATAYVVNAGFKSRLLDLLAINSLDTPYDLFLRGIISQGFVRASVVFPFATSISYLVDCPQLQSGERIDLFWNAFRRMIWADRDLEQVAASIRSLGDEMMDPESAVFAQIVGNALSTYLAQGKQ